MQRRLFDLLQRSSYLCLSLTEKGRGLAARCDIPQGTVILTENPLVAASAPQHAGKVCHDCLQAFHPGLVPVRYGNGQGYCSAECLHRAGSTYAAVECSGSNTNRSDDHHVVRNNSGSGSGSCAEAGRSRVISGGSGGSNCNSSAALDSGDRANSGGDRGYSSSGSGENFQELRDYCENHRERFPLLGARLACTVVAEGLSCQTYEDIQELCFANVSQPPPQPWAEAHTLVQRGLQRHVSSLPAGSQRQQEAAQRAAAITPEWFTSVMARLHVNTFRVDCVLPLPEGRSLADMATAILSGGGGGHSGSAVYLLASLFNHSCLPNCEVTFPQNNSTIELRAAHDIARGEEVYITYIDASAPFRERQEQLAFAYGFKCRCALCTAQEADLHMED